jgi:hypothetical protein
MGGQEATMCHHDKRKCRGTAAVEFALVTVVWLPLLLGLLTIGTTMIRAQATIQVARDCGHMYARGVDFTLAGSQAVVVELGKDLGMKATGADPPGDGIVILSSIMYILEPQCEAAGLYTGPVGARDYSQCINLRQWVFTHRWNIGNTALRSSNYGTPDPAIVNGSTGAIATYMTDTRARTSGFNLLTAPQVGQPGFQAGQNAYLVEAFFSSPGWSGSYSYSLF